MTPNGFDKFLKVGRRDFLNVSKIFTLTVPTVVLIGVSGIWEIRFYVNNGDLIAII